MGLEETYYYLHDISERNLQKGQRLAAERDRAMFVGRAILRKYEEEKNTSEARQGICFRFQECSATQDTGKCIPSLSDDTVPDAWAEPSAFLLRYHAK